MIFVAGTTAVEPNGDVIAPGDAYIQASHIFKQCIRAVEAAGGSRTDIVRTRMYTTNIERDADKISRAHAEEVGDVMPVATMVQISRLIHPDLVVEIEMEAFV